MTHSSPSVSARVLTLETSEPVSGSEMAAPEMAAPRATGSRYFSFCSSVPYSRMASLPNPVEERHSPIPGSAANSSSTIMAVSRTSWPAPPYSNGICGASSPISAALSTTSQGYFSARSYSVATGRISFSANRCTSLFSCSCSSDSSKSIRSRQTGSIKAQLSLTTFTEFPRRVYNNNRISTGILLHSSDRVAGP